MALVGGHSVGICDLIDFEVVIVVWLLRNDQSGVGVAVIVAVVHIVAAS